MHLLGLQKHPITFPRIVILHTILGKTATHLPSLQEQAFAF